MIVNLYLNLIYLLLALTPVFIWMFFYYKKDLHPEPKKMIFKIFILGMIAACLVAILEIAVSKIMIGASFLFIVLQSFLLIALVEEVAKYLVIKINILSSPDLDEPLDIMLYMVISALGFAAIENIVLFFAAEHPYTLMAVFNIALLRFIGAVFLHTLTSGALGFFIALSFCSAKNKKLLYFTGFFMAIFLHGTFNIAIIGFTGFWRYFIPVMVIAILLPLTTYGFAKLKKMKSICNIPEQSKW